LGQASSATGAGSAAFATRRQALPAGSFCRRFSLPPRAHHRHLLVLERREMTAHEMSISLSMDITCSLEMPNSAAKS
jgi:hypothetical protein